MTKEIDIIDPKDDFDGCIYCKYVDIPDVACKAMGCVHAFRYLMDCYTKENVSIYSKPDPEEAAGGKETN